ncbi:MAG: hypothetical protein CMH57_14285 [Myxococcales bacterium]|nr:hypothetical protein [Myxococcales bacterium]
MICADCGALTGGAVKKVVVCQRCDAQGRGTVGWRAWVPIVAPILLGVLGLLIVTQLLRSC